MPAEMNRVPALYVRTPNPLIGATCVVPAAVPSDLKRAALPALALEAGWAMKKKGLPPGPSQTGAETIGGPAKSKVDKGNRGTHRKKRASTGTWVRSKRS